MGVPRLSVPVIIPTQWITLIHTSVQLYVFSRARKLRYPTFTHYVLSAFRVGWIYFENSQVLRYDPHTCIGSFLVEFTSRGCLPVTHKQIQSQSQYISGIYYPEINSDCLLLSIVGRLYDYTGKVQPSTDVLHTTHVCNISGAHCNGDVNVWCIHYLQHFIITQAYIQCDGKILHKYVLYVKLFVVTFIMHVTCIVNVKQFRKGNSGSILIQVRCRVVCTIACIPRIRVQCPTDFSRKGAAWYLSRIYRNIMYYLS